MNRSLLLFFCLFYLCMSAHPASLVQGMMDGQARVQIVPLEATSGDSLALEVRNASEAEVAWHVPPGLVAQPENASAPPMAIRRLKGRRVDAQRYEPAEAIMLKPGEGAQYVVEAYSMDLRKPAAGRDTVYTLVAMREDLGQLFHLAGELGASNHVIQAAVWIAVMDVPREQLRQAIPIPAEDFEAATDLALRVVKKATPTPPAVRLTPSQTESEATEPPLVLEATDVRMGKDRETPAATVALRYRWTVPPPQRPRVYIMALRFEGSGLTSAVVPGRMIFDETEGAYESVVEQGALQGQGELVYAVLQGLTEAADPKVLNQAFDALSKEPSSVLISNLLRVPIRWPGASGSPLDNALAVISNSPATAFVPTPRPRVTPQTTPAPQPAQALDRALPQPLAIELPLPNGGKLKGTLLGVRDGQLVLSGQRRLFVFDPAHLGTPQAIQAHATQATDASTAAQWAAIASLLAP